MLIYDEPLLSGQPLLSGHLWIPKGGRLMELFQLELSSYLQFQKKTVFHSLRHQHWTRQMWRWHFTTS